MKTTDGHFGRMGGMYVPETLMPALQELAQAYSALATDKAFWLELEDLLKNYVGRPTPLYEAKRLAGALGLPGKLFLKREDLCHTGSHKINNALGQALLAKRLGKPRLIAETGAGQHGVATATAAALLGLECEIFMGAEDVRRQAPNVERMRILGATVRPVTAGTATLKDAMNEAMRDWVTHVRQTYYVIGSVAGPHPYPSLVRDFQAVIGRETRQQVMDRAGQLPDAVVACVGGGSNAMGIFKEFIPLSGVDLIAVEAAGQGLATSRHAASLTLGKVGVLHGSKSLVLQDEFGQVQEAHSLSAGLDYPGVGPEMAHLKESGRVTCLTATDEEALAAFEQLAQTEGIIPALETSHAIAALRQEFFKKAGYERLVVNLSGRGDKDLATYLKARG